MAKMARRLGIEQQTQMGKAGPVFLALLFQCQLQFGGDSQHGLYGFQAQPGEGALIERLALVPNSMFAEQAIELSP